MADVTFNTDNVKIYLAGAGSGKTHALMNELTGMLDTYRPDEIMFTTFTRRGVETGIELALMTHNTLSKNDLPFFATLHSLCFKNANLKMKDVVDVKHVAKFNELCGFKLQAQHAFNNMSTDTKLLQRYDAIRSGATEGVFIHSMYDEERYFLLIKAYEKFKQQNNLVDYYDCLERYLEVGKPLPISASIIDECQDLTPLQWQCVMRMAERAQVIRAAGDWAQCLYKYNAATPEALIALSEKYETVDLNLTYRLPKSVCAVANKIIEVMDAKLPRLHETVKEEDGAVTELDSAELLARIVQRDYTKSSGKANRWFMLFRCNYHIERITSELERLIIPYHTSSGFCLDTRLLHKIERYNNFRLTGFSTPKVRAEFMEEHHLTNFDADFVDTDLITSDRKYVYHDYVTKFGTERLLEMAAEPPWCLCATVYKVKGGEADNVAFFLDATKLVNNNLLVDLDGELRVMYVACTRAKEKLYIVQPATHYNLAGLWDFVYHDTPMVSDTDEEPRKPRGRKKKAVEDTCE